MKLKEPKCKRIQLCKPVTQNGWNETCFVDSTAIAYIAYHPKKQILRIIFHRNKWKGKKFRAGLYEYVEVPVEAVNKFFACPYERKRTLPSRKDSVGASFRRAIGRYDYDYRRKFLPSWFKYPNI